MKKISLLLLLAMGLVLVGCDSTDKPADPGAAATNAVPAK